MRSALLRVLEHFTHRRYPDRVRLRAAVAILNLTHITKEAPHA